MKGSVFSPFVSTRMLKETRLSWPTAAALAHGDEAYEREGSWKRRSFGVEIGLGSVY